MPMRKNIFLSHRFADKPIADVVRKHLQIWGVQAECCYQASAPGNGPTIGDPITIELKEALYEANLVILIYTLADNDWSFCMWECGLATNPKKPDTRTVVFQCNPHDKPQVYEGQQLVLLDEDGIKNFILQFFKEDKFFPNECAVRPSVEDDIIQHYSSSLYNELRTVIPPGRREERYRWDSMTLQLINDDLINLNRDDNQTISHSLLQKKCRVIKEFGESLKHFGYSNWEPDLTLEKLFGRWERRVKNSIKKKNLWIDELNAEIIRAIINEPSDPKWIFMKSAHYHDSYFYPVVNHVRVLPDGSMEFDIYFYRSTKKEDIDQMQ